MVDGYGPSTHCACWPLDVHRRVLPGTDYFRTTSEMVWVTVSASVLPPYVTTTG